MKKLVMAILGIVSAIYLINPGLGVFEIIPDNLPMVGNIDEAFAAGILLTALRFFGLDLTKGSRSGK